jgi:hypothetical protein
LFLPSTQGAVIIVNIFPTTVTMSLKKKPYVRTPDDPNLPHADYHTDEYDTLAKFKIRNYSARIARRFYNLARQEAEAPIPGRDDYTNLFNLEQVYNTALAGGNQISIGKARTAWDNAKAAYTARLGIGKGRDIPTPEQRLAFHEARRDAELMYEDFLFYQAPAMRRNIPGIITFTPADIVKNRGRFVPQLWGDDEKKNTKGVAHQLSQAFHHLGIGGPTWRGETVTHDKLMHFTPNGRRRPTGVGKPHWPKIRPSGLDCPLDIPLDEANIEARRLEIERERGGTMNGVHDQRRKAEIASRVVENDFLLREALKNTRNNKTGLYISANERPNDWPVSYDCLDRVRSGFICINPQAVTRNHQIQERRRSRERRGETSIEESPKEVVNHLLTTQWWETTYGRREYHVHEQRRPASPVDSPPHSPRPPPYDDPDYNPRLSDVSPPPTPAARVTRASAAREKARSDGKVTGEEEEGQGPPKMIPVDVPDTDNLYERYKMEFRDHYGIQTPIWPTKKRTVPYHPVDMATLVKEQLDKLTEKEGLPQLQDNLLDLHGKHMRPAPEGTSMGIVRDILHRNGTTRGADGDKDDYRVPTKYKTSHLRADDRVREAEDDDIYQDNQVNSGVESDDEGDLFTQSYRAGSGVSASIPVPHENKSDNTGFNNDEHEGSRKRRRLR